MIKTLRIVEAKWRSRAQNSQPKVSFDFTTSDFRIDLANSDFFMYPESTRMVEVWYDDIPPHKCIPFVTDLVRENGKLRIVAIYPPID